MGPLEWQGLIRRHPGKPSPTQIAVLDTLVQHVGWKQDQDDYLTGYVSIPQLAAETGVDERTVKRATAWARGVDVGLLILVKRGRYGRANEWRLSPGVRAITSGHPSPHAPSGHPSPHAAAASGPESPHAREPHGDNSRRTWGLQDPVHGDSRTPPSSPVPSLYTPPPPAKGVTDRRAHARTRGRVGVDHSEIDGQDLEPERKRQLDELARWTPPGDDDHDWEDPGY